MTSLMNISVKTVCLATFYKRARNIIFSYLAELNFFLSYVYAYVIELNIDKINFMIDNVIIFSIKRNLRKTRATNSPANILLSNNQRFGQTFSPSL